MKAKKILFIGLMILVIVSMFANVVFADGELIPNGEKYFSGTNSDSSNLMSGILGLFAIIIGAVGIFGLVWTIIYVAKMIFKLLGGKEGGKQTWKVAGTAFVVFALLSTGGWYGVMSTLNTVALNKAVDTFNKDHGTSNTNNSTATTPNKQ